MENIWRSKRKVHMAAICILVMLGGYIVIRGLLLIGDDISYQKEYRLKYFVEDSLQKLIIDTHMPLLTYSADYPDKEQDTKQWFLNYVLNSYPLLNYVDTMSYYETDIESMGSYEKILISESMDENAVDNNGKLVASEGAVDIQDTLSAAVKENEAVTKNKQPEIGNKQLEFTSEQLNNFDFLVNQFYVVDKTTTIQSAQLNIEALTEKDMTLVADNKAPQILIYHTHSQEDFVDSIQGDVSTTVVGLGDRLTELLKGYGYNVIHHTGIYDLKSRNYAYSDAGPEIERILQENPSIEVVIDLHRDGVAEGTKLVTQINEKQTAQFMFFNGLSRTTTTGNIDYLKNPYIADNLAIAFQLQLKAAQYYPGLARKIYLKGYRYNLHYKPKSLLIEVGAQTNTVEEVMNTMEPLADILDRVLSGKE